MATAFKLIKELKTLRNKDKAMLWQSFFKTKAGQYAEGDIFWGISVPVQRKIMKKYRDIDLASILVLLENKVHELRFLASLILVDKYQNNSNYSHRKEITDFYLKHLHLFNNWDLIDATAYKILGHYLKVYYNQQALRVLMSLAKSDNLWRKRASIVALLAFIKEGSDRELIEIVTFLQQDKHDLIAKASGWMLREWGKKAGEAKLCAYLDKNSSKMARVTLRYAIEKLDKEHRLKYLKV